MYFGKNQKVFNGKIVAHYPNGNSESYRTIKDGKATGKIETFYPSGENFSLGYQDENQVSYGKIILWNENGIAAFKGSYKNGVLYELGKYKPYSDTIFTYYENKLLFEQAVFVDGLWHG